MIKTKTKLKVQPDEVKETIIKVKVKDYSMRMHMSRDSMHSSIYTGTLVCEDLPLHNKVFCKETHTKKKKGIYGEFGKCTEHFYLHEIGSKMFKSFDAMCEHYNGKSKIEQQL